MKYKNLKSVAHNLGHAFLSLMNCAVGENYIIEMLFQKAKKTGLNSIEIDYLNEIIEPPEFRIKGVIDSLKRYRKSLPRDLDSQRCSIDKIRSIKIFIVFDLLHIPRHKDLPDLELPNYNCNVEIIDNRDKIHNAKVEEWWKY